MITNIHKGEEHYDNRCTHIYRKWMILLATMQCLKIASQIGQHEINNSIRRYWWCLHLPAVQCVLFNQTLCGNYLFKKTWSSMLKSHDSKAKFWCCLSHTLPFLVCYGSVKAFQQMTTFTSKHALSCCSADWPWPLIRTKWHKLKVEFDLHMKYLSDLGVSAKWVKMKYTNIKIWSYTWYLFQNYLNSQWPLSHRWAPFSYYSTPLGVK